MENMKLWAKLKSDNKIVSQLMHSEAGASLEQALTVICRELDIQVPILMEKHRNELRTFGRTVFNPFDFIEQCYFDTFEIESIAEKKKTENIVNLPYD